MFKERRTRYKAWKKQHRWLAEFVEFFLIILPIAFILHTLVLNKYKVPTGSMETTMLIGELFIASKYLDLWLRPLKRGDIISFNKPAEAGYKYSSNPLKNWWQMYVWGPENWTKRIIGMPGDHVQGKIEDGKPVIYLNGQKLDEPYVNKYPLIGVYDRKADYLTHRSYDPDAWFLGKEQPFYRLDRQKVNDAHTIFSYNNRPSILQPYTPAFDAAGRNLDEFDIVLGANQYWVMGDNRLGSADCRQWGPLDGKYIHGRIIFRVLSFDSDEPWLIMDLIKHPIDFWTRVRWSRSMQFVY